MLRQRVEEGLEGQYKGLKNGLERINKFIFGIQKKCYTLLGGSSGTFKTSLVDYMLLNAMKDAEVKGVEFNVFYYSFEIDKVTKMCNWLSSHIYQKYKVSIPPETIKGLGENRLTAYEKELVDREIPYIEGLFAKINFTFSSVNPTGIYKTLWETGLSSGKLIYEKRDNEEVARIVGYKPNNPEAYNLVIVDHIYLLHKERGFETKEVIDKFSEYCVSLRNIFGFSFILIQQFNDGLSAVDRQKFKGVDLSPQYTDFKDSRNPYQDADVVLGTMCPYKLDLNSSLGYDITKLKDKMIMLKVIKNRLSRDNIAIGLYVEPKAGLFEELPHPEEFNKNPTLYEQYK